MSWETILAIAGGLFMLGCLALFLLVVAITVMGRGSSVKAAAANAAEAVANAAARATQPPEPPSPSLSGVMRAIEAEAKAAAYQSVSDKIKAHHAGRFETELLDALAPKSDPAPRGST